MAKRDKKPDKEYLASPEFNGRLDGFVTSGRSRMSFIEGMTRDAVRYVYGDQHYGRKRKKGWEYPVINRMYAALTQEVAMLSANNPRIDTPPREGTDAAVAQSVGEVLKGVWFGDLKMRTKIIQGLYDDHLSGIKVAKWIWDPAVSWNEAEANKTGFGWEGKIELNVINPRNFGCDPDVEIAVEIPTKARFLHTERWMDKQEAAKRWPLYAEFMQDTGEKFTDEVARSSSGRSTDETGFDRSTNDWSGKDRSAGNESRLQARLADMILGESSSGSSQGHSGSAPANMVLVQEIYFRDYETEHVPAQMADEVPGKGELSHVVQAGDGVRFLDTTKLIEGTDSDYEEFDGKWPKKEIRPAYDRPKYPNGRVVIRLDNKVIVKDDPWLYKKWPFAVAAGYLLPHMWQGLNSVELSRGLQDIINDAGSHLINYLRNFSDPILEVEEGALQKGLDTKKEVTIANAAGAIVRLAKGGLNKIRRTPAVAMPTGTLQILDLFKVADQDIKGVHDIAQGKTSRSGTTLGEIELLNRNTRLRIGLQGAMLDEWLKQIAAGIIELMQANFKVGQWVRWTGDEPSMQKAAVEWKSEMASAKFDIILEPVSTLPYDEERVVQKYLQAFQITGPAMLEDVLVKMKIEKIPEILEKHAIIGPLTQLQEMAVEMGMTPEQLVQAINTQLQLLQRVESQTQGALQ